MYDKKYVDQKSLPMCLSISTIFSVPDATISGDVSRRSDASTTPSGVLIAMAVLANYKGNTNRQTDIKNQIQNFTSAHFKREQYATQRQL